MINLDWVATSWNLGEPRVIVTGRPYLAIHTNLFGLEDDLADQMLLTHYDGLGPDGDVKTPGFITRHRVDALSGTVTVTMLDLRRMGTLITLGGGVGGHPPQANVIALTAPSVTVDAVASLAAGSNTIVLTAPAAVAMYGTQIVAAGSNVIAFSAPAVTVMPVPAGQVTIVLTAPQAIAALDDALISDGDGSFLTTEDGTDVLTED
jgi:hypothetical protein